jgi:hypothetical protein
MQAPTIVIAFGVKQFPFFTRALAKATLNFKCEIVSTNLPSQVICALYMMYEFTMVVTMTWKIIQCHHSQLHLCKV